MPSDGPCKSTQQPQSKCSPAQILCQFSKACCFAGCLASWTFVVVGGQLVSEWIAQLSGIEVLRVQETASAKQQVLQDTSIQQSPLQSTLSTFQLVYTSGREKHQSQNTVAVTLSGTTFSNNATLWESVINKTACSNWGSIRTGNVTVEGSINSCATRCAKDGACIGFGYMSNYSGSRLCILRHSSCSHVSDSHWNDYSMKAVAPAILQCPDIVGGPNYCSKWCGFLDITQCGVNSFESFVCNCSGCGICAGTKPKQLQSPKQGLKDIVFQMRRKKPLPHHPEKVLLSPDSHGPWDSQTEYDDGSSTYGFYLVIYRNQEAAVLQVLRDVRKFYFDSPIHVVQDGGPVDLSQVCRLPRYGCSFEFMGPANSRWNPHAWLLRMYRVAKRLNTTYVIYLEPDVIVRRRHRFQPVHDAGGLYDNYNSKLHDETVALLQKQARKFNPCFKLRWRTFGLAGGSYFRTKAILDAFHPERVALLDWNGFFRGEYGKTFSSDVAMHIALSSRGYTVYPWREAAQNFINKNPPRTKNATIRDMFQARYPAFNSQAAFEHDHKELYYNPVPKDVRHLILYKPVQEIVTCHGCVWYTGDQLHKRLPLSNHQDITPLNPAPQVPEEHQVNPKAPWLVDEPLFFSAPSASDTCFPASMT